MRRNVLNSPRLLELKRIKQKAFLHKLLLYLFLFLVIFAGLVYVSHNPTLNINKAEIVGNQAIETEAIESAVQGELEGNFFGFFPKTNIFFYPKKAIKNRLASDFSKLQEVTFSLENRNTLQIAITEREAVYTWCEEKTETEPEKCRFVDNKGYIFDEAPYFSGDVYFKFYGSNFSEANFEKLISFKKTFEAMKLKPVAMRLDEKGNIRIILSSMNSDIAPPEIIFKIDSDFQSVIENLKTALGTEPLLTNFREKYSSLESIDLRFGNKVYYKFR